MPSKPNLSMEDRERLLCDLTQVGLSKPVGYLPLYTIRDLLKLAPEDIAADLNTRGLSTVQFSTATCCIKSGALYVYHKQALTDLLMENAGLLHTAGIPNSPDEFVARIAAVWFDQDHPAKRVVDRAFGDNG